MSSTEEIFVAAVQRVFPQKFFGQFLVGILADLGSTLTKYGCILIIARWFPSLWIRLNEGRIKKEREAYEENTSIMNAEIKRIATKQDDLQRSLATSTNLSHPQGSRSMNNDETISTQPRNFDRRGRGNSIDNGVEENEIEKKSEIEEIEAEVRINIPESSNSSKVVAIAQNSGIGTWPVSIKGSRILVEKVKLRDDILDKLSGLATICTFFDNQVAVQLGDCRIFIRTDKGVERLKLNTDTDKLPVILLSSYALGTLTIEGMNLKNATLKAATFEKSITLKNIEHKEVTPLRRVLL